MSLTLVEKVKSEFRIDDRGQCSVSIRGAARIVGVTEGALRKAFKRDAYLNPSELAESAAENEIESAYLEPSKLAKKMTEGGFGGDVLVSFADSGIPDKALALILEYYAFDAGRYCTEQAVIVYRAFASIGIRSWIQQKLGWKPPQIELPAGANPLQILELAARQMESSGCNPNIVAQWKIDQYASLYPAIGDGLRQAKAIVSASTDYPALPVSPTRLGQLITQRKKLDKAVSAEQVNKALANLGFQERGADRLWKLTEAGQEYGHLQQVVANGTPRPQLRWDVEILNQLFDLFL
jgi:hypothetical protein